jgi:hypothetical protein
VTTTLLLSKHFSVCIGCCCVCENKKRERGEKTRKRFLLYRLKCRERDIHTCIPYLNDVKDSDNRERHSKV